MNELSSDLAEASGKNVNYNNLIYNTLGLDVSNLTQVTTFNPYGSSSGNYTITEEAKYIFILQIYAITSTTGMNCALRIHPTNNNTFISGSVSKSWTGGGYSVMIYGTFFVNNYLTWSRGGGHPSSSSNTYGRLYKYE